MFIFAAQNALKGVARVFDLSPEQIDEIINASFALYHELRKIFESDLGIAHCITSKLDSMRGKLLRMGTVTVTVFRLAKVLLRDISGCDLRR